MRALLAAGWIVCSATLCAQSTGDLIARADALDRQFAAAEALELYRTAERSEPRNAHVLMRIARQYRHLMVDTNSRSEKLRLGRLALDYSHRAARAAPDNSEAQIASGITYGKMIPLLGAKEKIEASRRIRISADRALALDLRNDTAWHVLGRWHQGMAELTGLKRAVAQLAHGPIPTSTYETAAEAFHRAVAIDPNRLMHHIELGRSYAGMGRPVEARRHIEKGLSMPNREKDDLETKRRGAETLAKLP